MQPVGGVAGYPPSPFLVNLIELNNTITNADGLTPLNVVSNAVNDLQQMINFSQKRIYTNIISKYDQTPIQVTDDINLSNANLYQNGSLFTGSGNGTSGTGGISYFSSGTNSIFINSTITSNSPAIGFQVGGRTVFSFDGAGRALYFDPSGTGNRFWISSATLVADNLQVGGAALGAFPGKFLMSKDLSGTSTWSYVSSLVAANSQISLSSGTALFQTSGTTAGAIDTRQNWYLGNNSLTGNGDLITSNNVTVVGGGFRVRQGAANVGAFLTVIDSLGNIGFSTSTGSLSSFVIGDKIQNGNASVDTIGSPSEIRFTTNAIERARFLNSGFFGIGTPNPLSILDVNGSPIFRGNLVLSTNQASAGNILKCLDSNGNTTWGGLDTLQDGFGQFWRVSTATSSIQGVVQGSEVIRISTQGAYLGIGRPYGSYNLTVNGPVLATSFNSLSPLKFIIGATNTEVGRFSDSGNFGIGTTNPSYKLQVNGSQSNSGDFYVGGLQSNVGNLYVGGIYFGNGSGITNILTNNVGTGSNQLDVFEAQTRGDIVTLQIGLSTLSTIYTSSINAIINTGALSNLSTISSLIGPGIAFQISTFSTLIGVPITATQIGLSSLSTTSYQTTSSLSYSNASTLDQVVFSTLRGKIAVGLGPYANPLSSIVLQVNGNSLFSPKLWISSSRSSIAGLGIGYKSGLDLSGAIDVSGLIYSRGLRGITSPFGMGVGTSTTTVLNPYGYTPGMGWKFQIQGDVDISGYLYRNGTLYNINGVPDYYWGKNGSNVYYADGNVGIGTPFPSYPLDVVGRIRCWGVDVIQGPGPYISTSQGPYVSPWLYQANNIYYNLGGIGVGTGISSVMAGLSVDVSGNMRVRGDIDFTGNLLKNGVLYQLSNNWTKNSSNVYYNDGNVGIGTATPSYPLDVAGRIRCFGVDVIQGPGPLVSTAQGSYTTPWQYQGSNIYYNLGGVAMGTGLSSVMEGITVDISGATRIRGTVTASNYLNFSDKRWKKEFQLLTLDRLSNIHSNIYGYQYKWKDSDQKDIGFLAQDVLPVFNEAVSGDEEKGFQVAYMKFIPIMWEIIRDLGSKVSLLEENILQLQSTSIGERR